MVHLDPKGWRRSSRSGGNGQCVELHSAGAVRDSKHIGPELAVALRPLIGAIKADKVKP